MTDMKRAQIFRPNGLRGAISRSVSSIWRMATACGLRWAWGRACRDDRANRRERSGRLPIAAPISRSNQPSSATPGASSAAGKSGRGQDHAASRRRSHNLPAPIAGQHSESGATHSSARRKRASHIGSPNPCRGSRCRTRLRPGGRTVGHRPVRRRHRGHRRPVGRDVLDRR